MTSGKEEIEAAFHRLAPRFALLLARRFHIPAEVVPDIVQSVFVKALAKFGGTLPDDAYLWRMTVNQAVDEIRSNVRHRQHEVALWTAVSAESVRTVEGRLIAEEQSKLLNEAIDRLREPYKEIFRLLLDHELSLAEVARRRGVSLGSIYAQHQRGLERLRKLLAELGV